MTDDIKPYDEDDIFGPVDADGPARGIDFSKLLNRTGAERAAADSRARSRFVNLRPGPRRPRFDGKTMHFGKYNGTAIEAVPLGYIAWIFDEVLAGEMAQPEPFMDALARSFVARAQAVPAFKRALPRIGPERQGGRAPVVTGEDV